METINCEICEVVEAKYTIVKVNNLTQKDELSINLCELCKRRLTRDLKRQGECVTDYTI